MSILELAGCIIQRRPSQVLLLHRNTPRRVQWEIPGGKLEPAESAADAALREIKEELGVDVVIVERLGGRSFREDGLTMAYTWFRARIASGTPSVREPQTHDEFRYFDITELGGLRGDLSSNTVNFLSEVEAGRISL
ncbi:NUDIX hydrolase [Actinomadura coerulea]|uniref:NUDIX hydrolase n=1 Tax=Actinomadura coerulea TaxID=46159 RepID=UPI00342367E9